MCYTTKCAILLSVSIRLFIELTLFKNKVDALGGQKLLKAIQDELLRDPEKGDVIKGAGGIRKSEAEKVAAIEFSISTSHEKESFI